MTTYYRVTVACSGVGLAYLGERTFVVRAIDEDHARTRAMGLAHRERLAARVTKVQEVYEAEEI